jgi:hypothetical protein
MTSYQTTFTASQPRASMRPADDRRAISQLTSVAVAVALALLVFAVAIEMTMGYGWNEPSQPAARPLPGLGL